MQVVLLEELVAIAAGGLIDCPGVDEQLDDVPRSDRWSRRQRCIGQQRLAVVGREVDTTRVSDGDGDRLPSVEPARAKTEAGSPLPVASLSRGEAGQSPAGDAPSSRCRAFRMPRSSLGSWLLIPRTP